MRSGLPGNCSGVRITAGGDKFQLGRLALRLLLSLAGVAIVTSTAYSVIPHNPTTVGFAYLLLVLVIASTWGLAEATLASLCRHARL